MEKKLHQNLLQFHITQEFVCAALASIFVVFNFSMIAKFNIFQKFYFQFHCITWILAIVCTALVLYSSKSKYLPAADLTLPFIVLTSEDY